VSYDIYFVRRDPGQSFEDALEETEDSFQGDPGPLTESDLEQWDAVLSTARQQLGDVEVFEDETVRELTQPSTGIQLSLFHGEIAIRVRPDADTTGRAAVVGQVYDLARAVEQVTGLEGYDPQLDEPVSERPESVPGARRRAPDWDDDDGESDGTTTSLPARRTRRVMSPATADPGPARWWEFWKR
jgi:hypothetical protein